LDQLGYTGILEMGIENLSHDFQNKSK